MLQKTLNFEVKAIDAATGVVRAYVAGFGNIDRVGDIIVRGAFIKTIPQFLAEGIVLWNHDTDTPIGKPLDAGEDEKGLWVEFQLILSIPKAKEIFDLMAEGVIKKFSIGYEVRQRVWLTSDNMSSYAPADATPQEIAKALSYGAALIEIELYEISPVSIPANPNTSIESLKTLKSKALEAEALGDNQDEDTQPGNQEENKADEKNAEFLRGVQLRAVKRRAALRAKTPNF